MVLPIAIAGSMTESRPKNGVSTGAIIPIVPIGSFMAIETLRKGGVWTAPS